MDLSRDGRTLAVVSWEGPEPSGGRATLAVYDAASPAASAARHPAAARCRGSRGQPDRTLRRGLRLRRRPSPDLRHPGTARLPVLLDVSQRTPGSGDSDPSARHRTSPGTVRHTAALMFRPDGQLLTGSTSGVLRLVDPATGRETRRFTGAPGLTSNNTFTGTPDGRVLLSTGTAGVVRWDPATGRPLWSALIGEDRCGTAAVVGDQVLCGGRFGQVESLDLRTGSSTTARYDMQHGPVSDLLVSPDGRTLLELADTQPVLARLATRRHRPDHPAAPRHRHPHRLRRVRSAPADVRTRRRALTRRRPTIRSSGSSTPEPAPSSTAAISSCTRRSGPDGPASSPGGTATTKAT